MRRLFAALVAIAACLVAPAYQARPLTLDDLLHEETLGATLMDPTGRWLVLEHRGPFDQAPRFDYASENSLAYGRLQVVDLHRPAPARPLLARAPGPGVVIGAFSPGGTRLAIYRLHDHRWSLGIVTMATGATRWFDITPQEAGRGRALQWVNEEALLVIARADGLPPTWARLGWIRSARLPPAWSAAAHGEAAVSVLGSGAYAAVRERASPNRLLWIDLRRGAARELSRDSYFDLELSPDGRRVALLSSGADLQARGDARLRGPAGTETEATRLTLLDLTSGRWSTPCVRCDVLPQLLSWSPSGRFLLVLDRGDERLWTAGRLLRLSTSGAVERLGEGLSLRLRFNPVAAWTAWVGDDPVAFGRPQGAPRDDWFRLTGAGALNLTARLPAPDGLVRLGRSDGLTVLADGALWSVDGQGGGAQRLATGVSLVQPPPRSVTGVRLDYGPQDHWWVRTDTAPLARLSPSGLVPATLEAPPGAAFLAASNDATAAVYRALDERGVERVWVARPGAPAAVILTLNPQLSETDPLRALPVRHVSEDGAPVTSWLFLPEAARNGLAPPLVVRPYLGATYPSAPSDLPGQLGFNLNLRLLTAHGYAVLVPSLPRPGGRLDEPALHLADHILKIVEAAQDDPALNGRFDPNRMAIAGFSFGGYTVMAAITQTDRFRAAVAMSGISDLTAYWATVGTAARLHPEPGYMTNWHAGAVEETQPTLGRPPWVDPERYVRNSPLYAADRITTPLLLFHGDQDALSVSQSEAMYSALFRQGKDALLVTYWAGQHGLMTPGEVRDAYGRTFDFLDAHLADAPVVRRSDAAPVKSPAPSSASTAPSLR